MKTVLITGATGFFGRHLVEHAAEHGIKVIASARSSSNIGWLQKTGIPVVFLSLSDPEKLLGELNNIVEAHGTIDVVIHNAGITQSLKASEYYEVNYELTKNLIVALTSLSCTPPKFIFTSSIAALGPGDPVLFKPINENHSPNPVTHYGKSKLKAEQYVMTQKKLPWIIVRPTIIYGPREKNFFNMVNSVNHGLEMYVGSKKQKLSFIFVKDLADIFVKLSVGSVSQKVYNVCDGEAYSAVSVNQIIRSALNKKTICIVLPVRLVRVIAFYNEIIGRLKSVPPILNRDKVNEMEQLNWLCDNSKIQKELGYSHTVKLKEGMIVTINWYKKNGWL